MANDPNRDLLPVKEENNYRNNKGIIEKIDHQILSKLPRCELEDKFLRLLDEHTHLKKLVHYQEEKIKRLGTKLLRLISDKRSGKKNFDQPKESEDLHLKIIELEHENYALKDKNIVLKQQLANHSRHTIAHPPSVRSTHTSPLMSVRQSAPVQNEAVFDSTNKNTCTESQLHDAEIHINELNEEIKSLHCKINYLQQDIERNSLDSRKTKVTENIELIRLQRSLRQQAIQIAALQAQVKNSENNQKILKEELMKAHNDNDEALNLISMKQNEILSLCGKLEEKNLSRFEEEEMRERINDLMKERDSLKERSDLLMKTIRDKADEKEQVEHLKKLLAEEKLKKEQLEATLKKTQSLFKNIQISFRGNDEPVTCCCEDSIKLLNRHMGEERNYEQKEESIKKCPSVQIVETYTKSIEQEQPDSESLSDQTSSIKSIKQCPLNTALDNNMKTPRETYEEKTDILQGKHSAERMKLERELHYLREMLRSQTARCEAQQVEISRLMYELKVNDEKCNFTLQRLDSHLKLFENLDEKAMRKKETIPSESVIAEGKKVGEDLFARDRVPVQAQESFSVKSENEFSPLKEPSFFEKQESYLDLEAMKESSRAELESDDKRKISRSDASSSSTISKVFHNKSFRMNSLEKAKYVTEKKPSEFDSNNRFINQNFLESSDEDVGDEEKLEKKTLMKKLETFENDAAELNVKRRTTAGTRSPVIRHFSLSNSPEKHLGNQLRKSASDELKYEEIDSNRSKKNIIRKDLKSMAHRSSSNETQKVEAVEIWILWLTIDVSSYVWWDKSIQLLFVDFTFLDVSGAETETPDSLAKPESSNEKCEFNFLKRVNLEEDKKNLLKSLLNKSDFNLIVFKVVSDSRDNLMDCIEIGMAVVTVKQFIDNCNKGPFVISVYNMKNNKEVVGNLAIQLDATLQLF